MTIIHNFSVTIL